MSILKDKLLGLSKQLKRHTVDLPEVGNITLCELTARERIAYESFVCSTMDDKGRIKSTTRLAAKLVQLGTENDDQQKLFDDKDLDDILKLPASVVNDLSSVIAVLSGIISIDQEPAGGGDDDDDTETQATESDDPNDDGEL